MHWRPLNTITTKKLQAHGSGGERGGGRGPALEAMAVVWVVWVVWAVRVVWVGVGGGAQRACIGGH